MSRLALLLSALALTLAGCGGAPGPAARPNVLLIVVDTLRFDHLGAYGYGRPTSPEIDARLAARGVVVERAYSQAPWTLPSMASLHTGRRPEEMLDPKGQPFGIPEPAATLAEQLAAAGYDTAAFVANPTLHRGNGFAQGFATFETAPYEIASMARHADDVNAGALPWLRRRLAEATAKPAAAAKPFFLYLHYLDPHDPYDNAEIVDGRSPFFPEYAGRLRGTDVHGLYLGALALENPEQDRRQLEALYDSEVHYVDRRIGEVLAALPPEILASTLVVLTADHGEELLDHGGYKHGETLYEELIHVPLIFRWDGKLPAGRRLDGVARLLDIWPTLSAAAGAGAPPAEPEGLAARQGVDLLPALAGGRLTELPAFARHFAGGPLRLARIFGQRKEILFDRHGPVHPADEQERKLWQRDVARLARHELYDLVADPHEKRNLVAGESGSPSGERGEPGALLAELDPWLSGIRLFTAGLAGCREVEGELAIAGESLKARPLFLAPEDTFRLEKGTLGFHWRGEDQPKGLLIEGRAERVTAARASCDGAPLSFTVGYGGAAAGAAASASTATPAAPYELRTLLVPAGELPPAATTGGLGLWLRRPAAVIGGERDEETRRRLKALGYTG